MRIKNKKIHQFRKRKKYRSNLFNLVKFIKVASREIFDMGQPKSIILNNLILKDVICKKY
jgi:hypothetical protein